MINYKIEFSIASPMPTDNEVAGLIAAIPTTKIRSVRDAQVDMDAKPVLRQTPELQEVVWVLVVRVDEYSNDESYAIRIDNQDVVASSIYTLLNTIHHHLSDAGHEVVGVSGFGLDEFEGDEVEEFHHDEHMIVSSQVGWVTPVPSHIRSQYELIGPGDVAQHIRRTADMERGRLGRNISDNGDHTVTTRKIAAYSALADLASLIECNRWNYVRQHLVNDAIYTIGKAIE